MNNDDGSVFFSCGCMGLAMAVNLVAGGWSVNYLLLVFAGKIIPTLWAMAIGLFVGEFSIPAAVVVYLLKYLGVL